MGAAEVDGCAGNERCGDGDGFPLLHENGYVGAFTGRTGAVGPTSDPFDLPRLTVYHDDSVAIFLRKVDGAYDWLMWFQTVWLRVTQGRQRLKNRKGGNHAGTESRN